ncbi:MAG: hypothetical protein HS115_13145 [Spirochaetales bacterium]|nr:hypothetical protein [Spirochaetales bacterium]
MGALFLMGPLFIVDIPLVLPFTPLVKAGRTTVAFLLGLLISVVSVYPCCLPVTSSSSLDSPPCHARSAAQEERSFPEKSELPVDHEKSCLACPGCQLQAEKSDHAFTPVPGFLPREDLFQSFVQKATGAFFYHPADSPVSGRPLYLLCSVFLI